MKSVFLATLAAIAIQPIIFLGWFITPVLFSGGSVRGSDILDMIGWVLLVATPVVIVFGLPAFFALRQLGRATPLLLGVAGFLIASVPMAISGWPRNFGPGSSSDGNWHGRSVDLVVNGVPTYYGWLSDIESTIYFGLHGLTGALLFIYVWRRINGGPNYSIKGNTNRSD